MLFYIIFKDGGSVGLIDGMWLGVFPSDVHF